MTTEIKKERLAKFMAQSGACSRRDAERLIEEGRVTVNGDIVETPVTFVSSEDIINLDGKTISGQIKEKVWLFYKPTGLITTHKDPEGRPTVFEYAAQKGLPRVISVGRLDINSEGLLLLTNSTSLARQAELPSTGWKRTYKVRVFGPLQESALTALRKGITVEGMRYAPIEVDYDLNQGSGRNTWLFMTLTEGKNREIRKVLNHLGLQVNRLIRLSYGPYLLGDLKPGEIKPSPILKG